MDAPNKYYSLVAHNMPLVVITLAQSEYDLMTLYYKKKSIDISQQFDRVVTDLTDPEEYSECLEENMTRILLTCCHTNLDLGSYDSLRWQPLALEQLKHMRGVLSVTIKWSAKGLKERFIIELDDTHVRVITINDGIFHCRRSKREEWCGRLLTYTQASKDVQLKTKRLWGYESDVKISQACRVVDVTYVRIL